LLTRDADSYTHVEVSQLHPEPPLLIPVHRIPTHSTLFMATTETTPPHSPALGIQPPGKAPVSRLLQRSKLSAIVACYVYLCSSCLPISSIQLNLP